MKHTVPYRTLGAVVGMMVLILDSKSAAAGARDGIAVCMESVIPSLFPFLVLSILITGQPVGSSSFLLKKLGKLFRLPQGTEHLLIPAFLGGYPTGAQAVGALYSRKQITQEDAEHLLAFCNNAGPAFLFGMTGSVFPEQSLRWACWGIQILSAWMVSQHLRPIHSHPTNARSKPVSLMACIRKAASVMASICGCVILFRVLLNFLQRWVLWRFPQAVRITVCGSLELSNGVLMLSSLNSEYLAFLLCCGMLSFGGFCVFLQTASVVNGLSLKFFLAGKLLQAATSVLLAICFWHRSPLGLLLIVGLTLLFSHRVKNNSSIPAMIGV